MATYSGFLTAQGLPELADIGEVEFAAMTTHRAVHVTLRDEGGNAVLPPSAAPAPGSSPDLPIYVASLEGQTNRVRPEGGSLDSIRDAVTVKGSVTADVPALTAALAQFDTAGLKTLLAAILSRLALNDPLAGSSPDNPLYVGSVDGSLNRANPEGGWIDRILQSVSVQGAVTTELSGALGSALTGTQANTAAEFQALQTILSTLLLMRDPVVTDTPNVVFVDGVVATMPRAATGAFATALAVSTTAMLLAPANVLRKSLVITNNSTGTLYIGGAAVASSGASMGLAVPTGCAFSDFGDGVFIGDVWGIYSASASLPNVSVSDRS